MCLTIFPFSLKKIGSKVDNIIKLFELWPNPVHKKKLSLYFAKIYGDLSEYFPQSPEINLLTFPKLFISSNFKLFLIPKDWLEGLRGWKTFSNQL